MNGFLDYLSENGYTYLLEENIKCRLYILTISKDGKSVVRHYPFGIENLVPIEYLKEDIKSEFNE